jgi:cellulose synthase operon protein YhjU
MGLWNLYFAAKLYLFSLGKIAPLWLFNLAFALLLVYQIQGRTMRVARQFVAIAAGAALLYRESALPPFERVVSQLSNIQNFTAGYLLELAQRVIRPEMVIGAVAVLLVYLLLNRWVRVTTLVLIALVAVPLWGGLGAGRGIAGNARLSARDADTARAATNTVAGDDNDGRLAAFRAQESTRQVSFAKRDAAQPEGQPDAQFDIIVLHICSLSWDDLDVAKARNHALLSRFDYLFKNFSSAASYSGPAAIRVLRAACGQQAHRDLYNPAPAECHLFADLAQAGYGTHVLMNHDGRFDNFRDFVERELGVPGIKPESTDGLPVAMRAFDNSPILGDYDVLAKWYQARLTHDNGPVALYYNTVSLHDGNRLPDRKLTSIESYPLRLDKLLTDVDKMLDLIARSGRKAVVVFVPEHGAALRGDDNQIAGLREIPTPAIVHVPVGVKLIGLPSNATGTPVTIEAPTSFLALSQLLSNFVADSPFRANAPALPQYANDLPQTQMVGENEATIMMKRANGYVLKTSDGVWVEGK